MSLQDDLDRIAQLQGKSIPPGNVIQGFEPGSPPPPEFHETGERVRNLPEDEDEFGLDMPNEPRPEPSPLIPKPQYPAREHLAQHPSTLKETLETAQKVHQAFLADLTIFGNDATTTIASYKGREVELTKVEGAAVKRVVLRAIKRAIQQQLDEVQELLPRRKRRKRGADTGDGPSEGEPAGGSGKGSDATPAPRKRGRPRKVRA